MRCSAPRATWRVARAIRSHMLPGFLLVAGMAVAQPPPSPPPPTEQYLYDIWQRAEGLPQSSIFSVVQDTHGYLWVGTEEGLARFDGLTFTVFDQRNTPSLPNQIVRVLHPEDDGSLWIGTHGGVAHRAADGRFTAFTAEDGLPGELVHSLARDRAGNLWAGTDGGLAVLDDQRWRSLGSVVGQAVTALAADPDHGLWIGTQEGLRLLQDTRLPQVESSTPGELIAGLPDPRVNHLLLDADGLWVSTWKGIVRVEHGEVVRTIGLDEGLVHPRVHRLHRGTPETLWIATEGGLQRLRGDQLTTYTDTHGLPDVHIWSLWHDHEGSLWVGTRYGGLSRLRDKKITVLGTPEGLSHDLIWTITQDLDGSLWIGTEDGLNRLGPDGSLQRFDADDGLPSPDIGALYIDRAGDLWIGFYALDNTGLARYRKGRFEPIDPAIWAGAVVRTFAEVPGDPALWIGTNKGLYRRAVAPGTPPTRIEGLPHAHVRALLPTPEGDLWIATDGGLARLPGADPQGAPKSIAELDGTSVRSLLLDSSGTLWIGTLDEGLLVLQNGTLGRLSGRATGLHRELIHALFDDGQGWLWMSTNQGVVRARKSELEEVLAERRGDVDTIRYREADGMRSSECNGGTSPAGWLTHDGHLWLPTIQGVAIFDPAHLQPNPAPPPVRIEEVLVDLVAEPGSRLAAGVVELPPGARGIELRYTALSFLTPENVRFRYRLEGLDDTWVEAGTRRAAFYTQLPAGSYHFRVLAGSSDGAWNTEGASLQILVRAPFHKTRSFYAALALLVAAMVWGAHRLRIRDLLTHSRELEDLHQTLSAKNAEMERFTYAVSHDLKGPLFTAQGFLGLLERDLANPGKPRPERVSQDIGRLRDALGHMQNLLEDLLELSRVGRVLGPEEDVDLGEVARDAAERLAGAVQEHGVEVRIAESLPTVRGDRQRLIQVFQNLIENAVKYLGQPAEPRIEIVAVRSKPTGGSGRKLAVAAVRDNGIGIDDDAQEKIFDLFEQVDGAAAGSGLGLALVQRIVEAHGGRIWVESPNDVGGSTFFVALPRA